MAESGDVATWVGAVGTWVAIAGGTLAGVYALKLFRIERRRETAEMARLRDAVAATERSQAQVVSAWLGERFGAGDVALTSAFGDDVASIMLLNASPLPVYKVALYVWPESRPGRAILWQTRSVLAPRPDAIVASVYHEAATERDAVALDDANAVSVQFTDSVGLTWYRSRDGGLHRIVGDDVGPLRPDIEGEVSLGTVDELFPADDPETARAVAALRRPDPIEVWRGFGDAAVLWAAGDATAQDVVDAACAMLVAGVGGVEVATVAAISPQHAETDLPEHLDAALTESGLPAHERHSDDALRAALSVYAGQVVRGDIEPDRLTAWLLTSWFALDDWEPASELLALAREAEHARDTRTPVGDLPDRVRAAAWRLTSAAGDRGGDTTDVEV